MKDDHHVILGEFLRAQRKQNGLTQSHIAEQLGYSVDTISKIERGLMRIPDNKVLELVRCYQIPKDEFLHSAIADFKRKLLKLLELEDDFLA